MPRNAVKRFSRLFNEMLGFCQYQNNTLHYFYQSALILTTNTRLNSCNITMNATKIIIVIIKNVLTEVTLLASCLIYAWALAAHPYSM